MTTTDVLMIILVITFGISSGAALALHFAKRQSRRDRNEKEGEQPM